MSKLLIVSGALVTRTEYRQWVNKLIPWDSDASYYGRTTKAAAGGFEIVFEPEPEPVQADDRVVYCAKVVDSESEYFTLNKLYTLTFSPAYKAWGIMADDGTWFAMDTLAAFCDSSFFVGERIPCVS